jgi:hypothetical protein
MKREELKHGTYEETWAKRKMKNKASATIVVTPPVVAKKVTRFTNRIK